MLTAAQICTADPKRLNQGDVFENVALYLPPDAVPFVREVVGADGISVFERSEVLSELAVAMVRIADVVALSYACELDRVLRRIAKGRETDVADVATIAAVYPLEEFSREAQHNIRKENAPRLLLIEESTIAPGRVIDFSTVQPIPLARLISSHDRTHGLTDDGQLTLIRAFARHLGSSDREPGPDEPDLLAQALAALDAQNEPT